MDRLKEAGKAVSEKFQEMGSSARYAANRAEAEDPENPVGMRIGAAIDAATNKVEEKQHALAKEVHKENAKHGHGHDI